MLIALMTEVKVIVVVMELRVTVVGNFLKRHKSIKKSPNDA